jgi:hypothetical protein
MESHPCAAGLHIFLKGLPLVQGIGAGVQKEDHLVLRKKCGIQVIPILRRVVNEIVFDGHLREPPVSVMDKADMRVVSFGGIKSDHFEFWMAVLRPEPDAGKAKTYDEEGDYP